MLLRLLIQNVVLIDRLDIEFDGGLNVFTGETGAGKSVLLDSLSLALGMRADAGLVRTGEKQAVVTAEFSLPENHPVWALLDECGLPFDVKEPLLLRRIITADGKSRAFINDAAAGVGVLRKIGDLSVEIHGQFASFRLLNAATHKGVLDTFGGLENDVAQTGVLFDQWQKLKSEKKALLDSLEKSRSEEDFLRHAADELTAFAPRVGEEEELAGKRALMMNGEKLAEGLRTARDALANETAVRTAQRALERLTSLAPERFEPILTSLEQASVALTDASFAIEEQCAAVDFDPREQERIEERLFSLRSLARKYQTTCDGLNDALAEFEEKLASLDKGALSADALDARIERARNDYADAARRLSLKRKKTAAALDKAVKAELAPLKLEKAVFATKIDTVDVDGGFRDGIDAVRFLAATNPGQSAGALDKIASGGELSRFMLALNVVLASVGGVPTMVFDEVDSGVGGATASAVGERLDRLAAEGTQVLVVTHSPQVAAFGNRHFRIQKETVGDKTTTAAFVLTNNERREEIARMLAGASVTDASRAAADALIGERKTS